MRRLARGNDFLVLGLLLLTPIVGGLLDPRGWTLWAFVAAMNGALMLLRLRMGHQRETGKLLWVAWGLGLGYSLLLCRMLPGNRNIETGIVVAFYLWMLPFLNAKLAEERSLWVMALGVAYSAMVAILISVHNHPQATLAGAVFVFIHVLAVLHLSHSHHQAHPHSGQHGEWRRREWRWLIPVMVVGLMISAPVAWLVQTLDWERNLPSIGKLPQISTSRAPVFSARFQGDVPSSPYWAHPNAYVLPTKDGQWVGIWDNNDTIPAETSQSLDVRSNLATHRVGLDDDVYTYTQPLAEDTRFRLTGYRQASISEDASYATITAWKHYTDKILMGFDERLDALYLSIPGRAGELPTHIDLSGAPKRMPRTWALVQSWKQEGLSDEAFVNRTLDYFHQHLAYHFDHQSMRPEDNQLDWFLFEDRKGVCRHFANAFALMMRMGGIRSRVVGGFHGGALSEDGKTWVVRARDAHAWTEIWLDGQGWVQVDPTAVVPVEKGIPEGPELGKSLDGLRQALHWDGLFSTAGSANNGSDKAAPEWVQALGEQLKKMELPQEHDSEILRKGGPVLLLFLLVAAWWWSRRGRIGEAPEMREWNKLLSSLYRRGANEVLHEGPRSTGHRLAVDWPPEDRAQWMATVVEFERWKFGGQAVPGLVRALRQWRKRARRDFARETR